MFCCRLGGLSDGSHLEGHDWCHNFKEDKYFQQKEEQTQTRDFCLGFFTAKIFAVVTVDPGKSGLPEAIS